jgi:hypothetical protein
VELETVDVSIAVRHIHNFSVGMRAATHNGLWSWKLLLLLLLCATTFVIPVPHLDSFHTGRTQIYSQKKSKCKKSPGYMSGIPLHGFFKIRHMLEEGSTLVIINLLFYILVQAP